MKFNLLKPLIFSFCFSIFILSFNGLTVEVDNLYTGKILVTDKTQKTRVKAHRWAIEQVIAKVSGSKDVLSDPKIKKVVQQNTANYIKSFAFVNDEQGRTFLVDEFDQIKIDKLLKSVGAAIWGQRRPNTVVWLVIEEAAQRSIIDQEQFPQLYDFIAQSSDDRGLPVVLPAMDQTDKGAVFTSDVWARFEQVVWQGSERYQADNIVMARMRYVYADKEPEYKTGWLLQFELISKSGSLLKSEFNGDQFSIVRDMINQIGDYFAAEYAIESESLESEEIYLTLNNIPDMITLHKVETILHSLAPVSDVFVHSITNESAVFFVELTGEGLDLIKALALLPQFQQVQLAENKQETLTVEQQLEQLTRDYLQQTSEQDGSKQTETINIDTTEQKNDTAVESVSSEVRKPKVTRINLFYNWLEN